MGCSKGAMPQQKRQKSFAALCRHLSEKQAENNNQDRCNKQEQAQAVDAMHVFHPLRARLIWVGLAQVQVLGDLAKNIHRNS
jgi:hypothetical protein